jgi:hypothetical protein
MQELVDQLAFGFVCGEVVVVANAVRIWVNGASSVRTVCGNAQRGAVCGGGVPAAAWRRRVPA